MHDTQTETYCEGRPAQGGLIPLGILLKLGKFFSFTCTSGRTAFAVEKAFYTRRTIFGSMRGIQNIIYRRLQNACLSCSIRGRLNKIKSGYAGSTQNVDGAPLAVFGRAARPVHLLTTIHESHSRRRQTTTTAASVFRHIWARSESLLP